VPINAIHIEEEDSIIIMSFCFRQVARRTLLCSTSSANHQAISRFGAAASASSSSTTTTILQREFSAAKKKQAINGSNNTKKELSYQERKEGAKQQRRETWDKKQSRLEHLKTRRDHSPKDVKRTLFRSWWDKELLYHNKLQRLAKKEGKPWRIRVAAMVERLPVVTPDVEEWEQDYIDLRDFLMTFGKDYPAETGFMFAPDKEEDHVVESDEDLIGKFCLVLFCFLSSLLSLADGGSEYTGVTISFTLILLLKDSPRV
jgi:hypothetical protein